MSPDTHHLDLNAAAGHQSPPKRARGCPRKIPLPPPPPPQATTMDPNDPIPPQFFSPKDLVWGKNLTHPSWPGVVMSLASGGTQILVSFFGEKKALGWCEVAQVRPFEAFFHVGGELYGGKDDEDFYGAVDASIREFYRRAEAAVSAGDFEPKDFLSALQNLAVNSTRISRLQAARTKAHFGVLDKLRYLPDPPEYVLELGLVSEEEHLAGGGRRGRRKSAGRIYAARKEEDPYWFDVVTDDDDSSSDFDDGDASGDSDDGDTSSTDDEGRKRKLVPQNMSANKKAKQEGGST